MFKSKSIQDALARFPKSPSWAASEDIVEDLLKILSEDRLSIVSGGLLTAFEDSCADFWGNKHCLAFSSGTGAIHSALFALGVGPGTEVVVPTYGFHSMVTPVLLLGATPVFCDVSSDSLALEPEDIEKVRTSNTRGVIVLHPWGNLANLSKLREYTKQSGMFLVSDASHAHGALFDGVKIGRYADVTCASFGKDKLISGGELGSASTDDPELWDRMAMFSHPNRVPSNFKCPTRLPAVLNAVGTKYRPHGMALVIANHRLKGASEKLSTLTSLVEELTNILADNPGVRLQKIYPGVTRVYWKIILIGQGDQGEKVIGQIKELAASLNVQMECNHYNPLLHQNFNYATYYRVPSCRLRYPKAESTVNRIIQIHALNLLDTAQRICYKSLFTEFNRMLGISPSAS